MAGSIKGITIEILGKTDGLVKSLGNVNKSLAETQKSLKTVNQALKLDPKNVDALKTKQEILSTAIQQTGEKLKLSLQLFAATAFTTNHAAGIGRPNDHAYFIAGTFDLDLRNAGETQRVSAVRTFVRMLLNEIANLFIFDQKDGKLLFGSIPTALPTFHDADSKRDGIYFLTHS